MQDILVSTRDSRSWQSSVQYAARLAAMLDGSVTAVYSVPLPMFVPDVAAPALATEIIEICREESAAARRAQPAFERFAREVGARSATWHVAEGTEPAILQAAARWHDLLVLERTAEEPDAAVLGALGQSILHADLPCIILPSGVDTPQLDTIAIAWKETAESIRAVHAALPLLARAKRIVIICGERGISAADSEDSAQGLLEYLCDHGLNASLKWIDAEPQAAGECLLAAAKETSADLLVMGAYGRTRFSEWIFGGATRCVLESAAMPVFMRH